MSGFTGAAAGIGAAATVGGAISQGQAAEEAAGISAAQAAANAQALRRAGSRGENILRRSGTAADRWLRESGLQADELLQAGYQGAREDLAPYDYLGQQGSNELARYLGIVPQADLTPYGVPRPAAPAALVLPSAGAKSINIDARAKALEREWYASHPKGATLKPGYQARFRDQAKRERDRQQQDLARQDAEAQAAHGAAQSTYEADVGRWEADQSAYNAQQQTQAQAQAEAQPADSEFGDYFDPYDVPEPIYEPFREEDLATDPLYQTELDENVRAWDQSAAARGGLMSGNTVAGLRELTAGGIGRARERGLQDYGITHDEWLGGYRRDFNERQRRYNALLGLNTMGLGVRSGLAEAGLANALQRANIGVGVGANRANIGVGVGGQRANALLQGAGAQADYAQRAADARASGQLAQGTAYGNVFGNIGSLGLLYGAGAFGNQSDDQDDDWW